MLFQGFSASTNRAMDREARCENKRSSLFNPRGLYFGACMYISGSYESTGFHLNAGKVRTEHMRHRNIRDGKLVRTSRPWVTSRTLDSSNKFEQVIRYQRNLS